MKRFIHSILPSILLSMSVGQIYAFSMLSKRIAEDMGVSQPSIQVAFSLGIFFLGMGAAFFGRLVERNIRLSTIIGTCLFLSGLCVAQVGIHFSRLWLLYLGYGFLLGTGTGIVYLSPVKTLMMWFEKNKGTASAIPIIFFGLGSSLCVVILKMLEAREASNLFFWLAGIYVLPMAAGILLLKKPEEKQAPTSSGEASSAPFSYIFLLKNGWFQRAWLFMFLNISCGLALIPLSRQFMEGFGYQTGVIVLTLSVCGIMNGGGRLVFAFLSDCLRERRIYILFLILGLSLISSGIAFFPVLFPLSLLLINAGYGAGFSTIPSILSDHFGMENVSKIHGAVLSAWGVAGLVGNQISISLFQRFGASSVLVMLTILYAVNIVNVCGMTNAVGKR